ncbi:MAG TPA: FkbM family methyltransferase [Thermoanaerobaculia bacterium]|nr:FkbM family methyltransferase [Thermoanaerobaculia bacterium]
MLSTSTKIAVARSAASFLFALGVKPNRIASRGGVNFDLDLNEAVDFSIFLLGRFQGHILVLIRRLVPADGVVIDIGANFGSIALPAAAMLPRGRVLAIEPTEYAFAKLRRNIELNPLLQGRIELLKCFVADETRPASDMVAYSSWPLMRGKQPRPSHPVHRGVAMETMCGQMALDAIVAREPWSAVSLIKIDTDGHEFSVLRGGSRCLANVRPAIVFEACQYLMEPPRATFEDFEELFRGHSYTICSAATLQPMSAKSFRKHCPQGGGLDLVVIPNERR